MPNAIVRLRALLIAAALNATAGISLGQTTGPSFDCAKATAVEVAICADPDLVSRDRAMAELYAATQTSALGFGLSQERKTQREWLRQRDAGCANRPTANCLRTYYDERLKALAVAALISKPDASLETLKRIDPKSAPLYEAIYRYATIDNPAARAAIVEKLIAPIFDAIHDKPWAENLFSNIPTARSAASSDDTFGIFLDVASVSDFDLTLPCAALIRRPGLSSALQSQYGGAIDGSLMRTDCEATLPALPAWEKLERAAMDAQPTCQGTIRFSLGREYMRTLVMIRLHSLDVERTDSPRYATDDDSRNFRADHPLLVDAARDELTKYYSDVFKVEPKAAQVDAYGGVNATIHGAYNVCEGG